MPIILFEGFDGTGKSSIAKELSIKLNIPYFKKPNDDESLTSNYNPEMSLIYETRKFIEFLDAKVIKDVIIDRDYISEFAYGKILRDKIYKDNNIERFIWLYDSLLFKQDFFIIYCFKNNDTFIDKYNTVMQNKEEIINRYSLFMKNTHNRVLLLNTTDKDLKKQLEIIETFILKIQKIDQYNKNLYFEKSFENKKIYFPGSFIGNEILFIGQNPGTPNSLDTQSVKLHTHRFDNYKEFLLEHEISYKKSKYYKFIENFAYDNFNISNKEFSFTNIVKFNTLNNRAVTNEEIEDCIGYLTAQIRILKPKKIITFGKDSHITLENLQINHIPYKHPSAFNYSKTEKF